jgi:site-specific recombinase XerD
MSHDTRKKDNAPRGVYQPRKGLWAIRFACGAGCPNPHKEVIGPIKSEAIRAYHDRKRRAHESPGWCPRDERHKALTARQQERDRERARITFEAYARDYSEWAKGYHRSWRKDQSRLSRVLPALGPTKLDEITTAVVERFIDGLGQGVRAISPATRNRYRDLLSGMFKRAKRLGLVTINPVQGIPKAKESGGRIVYLPRGNSDRPAVEERALYAALPAELRPAFVASVNTGLRWGEQAALRWRDVNLLAGTLTVETSKNGDGRAVPLNAPVRAVLMDLSLYRPRPDDADALVFAHAYRTTARAFERAVKTAQEALRKVGADASVLDGYTWHCNRHTFASRLVMAGVDLLSVQRLGGWRTLSMVQRYAHLAPDHLRAAVERLAAPGELDRNLTRQDARTERDIVNDA